MYRGVVNASGHEQSLDDDFTVEELRLEKEVEQALSELEAADATIAALRMQLENATDDVALVRRDLSQLKGVTADWETATDDGRRELLERERRVEELLSALPPELQVPGGNLEAHPAEGGLSPRSRRLEIAADRARVLAEQTSRLEEQVCMRQLAAESTMAERGKLEQQAVSLERDRDSLRASLREVRAEVREAETRLKRRDEILVATAQKRQTLERQMAHSRAEVNGLHARLAAVTAAKAASDAAAAASTSGAAAAATDRSPAAATSPAAGGTQVVQALPGEDARAVSLRLQREIVELWEQLKRSDEAG